MFLAEIAKTAEVKIKSVTQRKEQQFTKKHPSLRGGTTRQPPNAAVILK